MKTAGSSKSSFREFLLKDLSLVQLIGLIIGFLGLVFTVYTIFYQNKDSKLVITGYVFERDKNLIKAIPESIIDFPSNIEGKGTTNNSGRFSVSMKGNGVDSVYLKVVHPDGRSINKTVVINFDQKNVTLDTIFFVTPVSTGYLKDTIPFQDTKQLMNASALSSLHYSQPDNTTPDLREPPPEKSVLPEKPAEADFAIYVMKNGKYDANLYTQCVEWLSPVGSLLQRPLLLPAPTVTHILNGETSLITQSIAPKLAKHICILSVKEQFEKSSNYESLIVSKWQFELLLIEAKTGNIKKSFSETKKAAGISQENATLRVLDDFSNFLKQHKAAI